MIAALAVLLVLGACAASVSRLISVVRALPTELGELGKSAANIRALASGGSSLEQALALAALAADRTKREGALNEALLDIEHELGSYPRLGRVCASVCSSGGMLFAAVALRRALPGLALGEEGWTLVSEPLGIVAVGAAGATFCFALHGHARSLTRDLQREVDAFAEANE